MKKIITLVAKNASFDVLAVVRIDLTKNGFTAHGINTAGKPILVMPLVRRKKLPPA